jgi:membrane protease subunit HflC
MSDLVSGDEKGSRLPELEAAMLTDLKGTADNAAALSTYGIEPVAVGISGLTLPPETTREVFKTMKAARDKIANSINVQGTSDAARIRSEADSNARKIEAFASELATTIRRQGDVEAAKFLGEMKQDPQLAVFIQNMDFLRNFTGKRTTLVLPTWLPGFEMFRPDAAKKFQSGRPPVPELNDVIKAKVNSAADEPETSPKAATPVAGGAQ